MNMNNYTLLTDVTCDLDAQTYDSYGIVCIPMGFRLGDREYTHYADEREISTVEFYERLKAGEMPSTTQINPVVYQEYFEASLKEGKDVCYLCFSSGLSGTYNTARMIASELLEEYPDRRIEVYDTRCASAGEGFVICKAGEAYKAGATMDEVLALTEEAVLHACHWFMVDNLMHLKRGGRLSSIEAILGTALKIQPILSVDEEGKLVVVSKERGAKNAIAYLVKRLKQDAYNPKEQTVFLAHAGCPEKAEYLKELLVSEGLVADAKIYQVGPIIGSHVGNGMCALVFEGENYKF